jgi:hypothetical protein
LKKLRNAKTSYAEKSAKKTQRIENNIKWAPRKDILDDVFSTKDQEDMEDFMDTVGNFGQ